MSRRLKSLLGAGLIAWSATGSARAEQTVMALTEALVVDVAARQAPSVMASEHDATSAEEQQSAVGRTRLPDLIVTARYTRLSSIPERFRTLSLPLPDQSRASVVIPQVLDSYGVRAALVLPLSDAWLTLAANVRALGHVAAAKRLEVEATRARVAYEARAAFLLYRRARGSRQIADAALDVANAQASDQRERVRAGTAPPSSVLTFDAASNAAGARLLIAEAEVVAAEAGVRAFLPPSLATAPFTLDDGAGPPLLQGSVESSAVFRAAKEAVLAMEARVDAETLSMLPRLSFVAGAELAAPSPRAFAASDLGGIATWDATLQLDWSLSALTTGNARRGQAVAEHEALRSRAEELRRQLRTLQTSAAAARTSAEARVAASQFAVVTATKLAATRRDEFAAGLATPLDVINAEAERVRAVVEQADADLELRLAYARLAYAAGYAPRVIRDD